MALYAGNRLGGSRLGDALGRLDEVLLAHQEAGGYTAKFDGTSYRPGETTGGIISAPDRESWLMIRREIVGLYDLLLRQEPSPVVELNRAVAVAMRDSPEAGLALIDAILARGDLADYHLAHAARADLCRRLGRTREARAAYERALSLAQQEPERRFLGRRLAELTS